MPTKERLEHLHAWLLCPYNKETNSELPSYYRIPEAEKEKKEIPVMSYAEIINRNMEEAGIPVPELRADELAAMYKAASEKKSVLKEKNYGNKDLLGYWVFLDEDGEGGDLFVFNEESKSSYYHHFSYDKDRGWYYRDWQDPSFKYEFKEGKNPVLIYTSPITEIISNEGSYTIVYDEANQVDVIKMVYMDRNRRIKLEDFDFAKEWGDGGAWKKDFETFELRRVK